MCYLKRGLGGASLCPLQAAGLCFLITLFHDLRDIEVCLFCSRIALRDELLLLICRTLIKMWIVWPESV